MSITIAPATPADAAAMLDLQRRAFAEEGQRSGDPAIPPLAEPLAAIAEHVRSATALTARDGTRVVGSIRGIVDGTVCTIRGLAIEPAQQGRGLGSALLRALEAAHPQVTRFELTTNTVMERNVRFYERHGYHVTALTPHSAHITLAQMAKDVGRGDA